MDQNIMNAKWPEELRAFPQWKNFSGSFECCDVGEYDGVKINTLYVRGCSAADLDGYRDALIDSGYTEKQPGKLVLNSAGKKLCVDMGISGQNDGDFCLFFSVGSSAPTVTVTARVRIPGQRREIRQEKRTGRKSRRVKKRGVRRQRRKYRRFDRRLRREYGE